MEIFWQYITKGVRCEAAYQNQNEAYEDIEDHIRPLDDRRVRGAGRECVAFNRNREKTV